MRALRSSTCQLNDPDVRGNIDRGGSRGNYKFSFDFYFSRLSDFLEIYFLNYFVVCHHQHHQCQTITQQNNKSRNATSRNSLVILILEVSTSSGKDFFSINCEREWMNPVRMGALILFIDSEAILQSKATTTTTTTSAGGDDTSTPNNQKLKIHFALQNGTTS